MTGGAGSSNQMNQSLRRNRAARQANKDRRRKMQDASGPDTSGSILSEPLVSRLSEEDRKVMKARVEAEFARKNSRQKKLLIGSAVVLLLGSLILVAILMA